MATNKFQTKLHFLMEQKMLRGIKERAEAKPEEDSFQPSAIS